MNTFIRAATFGAALTVAGAAMADTQMGTIVDVASDTDNLSTLVTAVQEAGLVETLSGEGPFTVFAPTNDAFGALPEGTLDAVLADQEQLTSILTYHVVGSEVMAADLVGMIEGEGGEVAVSTVNGAELTASVDDGTVVLTDAQGNTANVIATDVEASNGVVHVIDGVLMP